MTLPDQSNGPLWVCHECELIGTQDEAERHLEATNHRVDELPQGLSDGVRDEWRKAQTARATAFLSWTHSPFGVALDEKQGGRDA